MIFVDLQLENKKKPKYQINKINEWNGGDDDDDDDGLPVTLIMM